MLPLPDSYSVGCDWVTLTYAPGTIVFDRCLWDGRQWIQDWCQPFTAGFAVKPWRAQGYAGWQCGPARIGRRDDSAIVIISSSVVGKPVYLPYLDDARCTRLDIRLDCYYESFDAEMDHIAEADALSHRSGRPGRPYLVLPVRPNPGHNTLYIGKRESPLFVRLYNKQGESGGRPEYKGCWRLEVELKDEAANDTFHSLRSVGFAEDVATDCCLAYCADRGLRFANWDYGRWDVTKVGAGLATDVARKLNWLSTGVAPAIRFLLRNSDIGHIITALGLQAHVTVKEQHYGGTGTERRKLPASGFERANALVSEIRRRAASGEAGSGRGGR